MRQVGPANLTASLTSWADERPGDLVVAVLGEAASIDQRSTIGALRDDAHRIAADLRSRGLMGRPVLLLARSDLDFVRSFFGCLIAGAIAVPVPPPAAGARMARLRSIARDTGAGLALGRVASDMGDVAPGLRWVDPDDLGRAGSEGAGSPLPDSIALLQYTSGSTADPRGVALTHSNLAANADMVRAAFGIGPHDRFLSWLPLFHDMGLMALIVSVACRIPLALMAPVAFLRRPLDWLRSIGRWRATISGGPNFAFAACARAAIRQPPVNVDLTGWATAFCGAEPVRAATLADFATAFAPHGFRPEALFPCYGLAEATVFVAGGYLQQHPAIAASGSPTVDCGCPTAGTSVRIVDPATLAPTRDGVTGEIWVAGEGIGQGYWNRPEETAATFGARLGDEPERLFLRTGDLGSLQAGRLVIRGRLKDTIIHRGANLEPADLEGTLVASHPAFGGAAAVFALETGHREVVVGLQELDREADPPAPNPVTDAVLAAIAGQHGVRLHDLVILRHGALPRTTSGKIRRADARELYRSGALRRVVDNAGHMSLGRNQADDSG